MRTYLLIINRLFMLGLCLLPVSLAGAKDTPDQLFNPFQVLQNKSSKMVTLGDTSQPIGHFNYCIANPNDCTYTIGSSSPRKLTRLLWAELNSVNLRANRSVKPVSDLEQYSKLEYWTLPGESGDCEDYVLLKRKMLLDRGWPASSLLVTVVKQEDGSAHAVLTVRTKTSDYILDNLNNNILPWNKTDYRYLKRQSTLHSGIWSDISDTRDIVSSIKLD